jgi:hypothetical protein
MAETTQIDQKDEVTGTTPEGTSTDQGAGPTGGAETADTPETPTTWDEFLAKQPDPVKGLYEEHTKGLKSALASEREKAADLGKQLRDAAKGADDATAAKLNELAAAQETAEKRAQFYEVAASEDCANLRLAWIAAQDMDAFDKSGNPDIRLLKEKFPELFRKPASPGSPKAAASAGTGSSTPPGAADMDSLIRRAAGRNV